MLQTCNHTLASSVTSTQRLDKTNVEDEAWFNISHVSSSLCVNASCCSDCSSSILSCSNDCISSAGLSFTCFSDSAPSYAASLTLTDVIKDKVVFNESFRNMKQLNIINSKLHKLQIYSNLRLQTLTIHNSSIAVADIYDTDSFRYVEFINCTFGKVKFSKRSSHSFEFHVHANTVNTPKKIKGKFKGVLLDLSESQEFPNMIERVDYFSVNLSSCNLRIQPVVTIRTITLDMSHNNLSTWHYVSYMQNLHLQNNSIKAINFTSDMRHSEARLQYLDLSNNLLEFIREFDFFDLPNIRHLKLRSNRIVDIHVNSFSFISKLRLLDLSSNLLHSLKRGHFLYLSYLEYLFIQNNNIRVVEGMFDGLTSIIYLEVDSYTVCCAQPKTTSKIQCKAPVNEISSCNNLIDVPLLSTLIWYMALFAVFGNLSGLIYRSSVFKFNSKSCTSFVMFSINLGTADLLMGIYLFIIAGANLTFSGRYGLVDESWRHSHVCTIAGVLATLSSEASVLFVFLITVDRILIIRFPFSNLRKRKWVTKLLCTLVWTISLTLSFLPLLGSEYFSGYYSSSSICISLPLSVNRKPGWEYSLIIFVGANSAIFIGILLGQLVIFLDVVKMGKRIKSIGTAQRRREMNLAKTLIAVAVTDLLCWIPIGVIGKKVQRNPENIFKIS